MIFLEIGSTRRPLREVTESWIAEQVGSRRAQGRPVCLRVQIQENGYGLSLATSGCPASGRGRPAHRRAEDPVH